MNIKLFYTIKKCGSIRFFFWGGGREINIFIQKCCIKLIKSDIYFTKVKTCIMLQMLEKKCI